MTEQTLINAALREPLAALNAVASIYHYYAAAAAYKVLHP